ncbi:MAG: hypothetical protein HY897_09820 [Deltaproteobacteria bacterium]|nr:hypothetical protein [Deltaproteobacteria bacterium]
MSHLRCLCLLILTVAAISAVAFPAAADKGDSDIKVQLKLGAGWYASPGDGIGVGGWQAGTALLFKVADYGLLGPDFYYTGMTGEAVLEDLSSLVEPDRSTTLSIHQMRFGIKALFNPAQKMSKVKYFWPYGGLDIGLAAQYVTDRGGSPSVGDGSADLFVKPTIGVLFYPRSAFTGYFEMAYNIIPTYAFTDKTFNINGAPEDRAMNLNTDGFIMEAGISYEF